MYRHSLGSTQALAQEASRALLPAYREVRQAVRASASACVDETGWKLRTLSRWLWAGVTERATLFHLGRTRGAKDLRGLLGRDYTGVSPAIAGAPTASASCGNSAGRI